MEGNSTWHSVILIHSFVFVFITNSKGEFEMLCHSFSEFCEPIKPISLLIVGIEKRPDKVINLLREYVKSRRIKRVILFKLTNNCPILKVEKPFEWDDPVQYLSYYNKNDYRLESITAMYPCELVLVFSKTFHLTNCPFYAIAQSEIIHCKHINKQTLVAADTKYQNCKQRLGK